MVKADPALPVKWSAAAARRIWSAIAASRDWLSAVFRGCAAFRLM
jgi:hypothetical protein